MEKDLLRKDHGFRIVSGLKSATLTLVVQSIQRILCYSIFEVARLKRPVVMSVPKGALPSGKIQCFYNWSTDNTVEIEKGWIIKGDTITELAAKLGMDPKILKCTVVTYNRSCEAGEDWEFGRIDETLVPIDTPPYYALKMYPGGPNTQGGPKRNAKSQVLDFDGNPIPRLYTAGELGSIYSFLYPASGGNVAELIAFGARANETDKVYLTFYNSHHAASAMLYDSKIISTDNIYESVKGLRRINPYSLE